MTKIKTINLNEMYGISENDKIEKEAQEGILEVNISNLVSFNNHPFKLYQGERLDDMVTSIKEHGIITPLIVRPKEDGKYEILSGHNRANAGKLAGLTKVPVVIKEDLTDEEAMLIVTETNLIQRSFSELTHSEKARILTERHNAIKNQGKRMDIINEIEMMSNTDGYEENSTSCQFEQKLESREKVANSYDLSPSAVARYLRIDMLINELKIRLDNNEIPVTSGVDLSFLKKEEQKVIEQLLTEGYKIDLKKSDILKTLSKGRNFTYEKAKEILSGKYFEKPKKATKNKFTPQFTKMIIQKYVTEDRGIEELQELIKNLLEKHFPN